MRIKIKFSYKKTFQPQRTIPYLERHFKQIICHISIYIVVNFKDDLNVVLISFRFCLSSYIGCSLKYFYLNYFKNGIAVVMNVGFRYSNVAMRKSDRLNRRLAENAQLAFLSRKWHEIRENYQLQSCRVLLIYYEIMS